MATDYGLAYLKALKAADPGLLSELEKSGKLDSHLSSVRRRAARMHSQLASGWKRLNPYDPSVHQSPKDYDLLATRAAEKLVLDGILPRRA